MTFTLGTAQPAQSSARRPVRWRNLPAQVPRSSSISVYHMGLEGPHFWSYIQVPEGKNLRLGSFTGYKYLLWS